MSELDRIKWDRRYLERDPPEPSPSSFLLDLDDVLPRRGRALDVAGGAGRHAVWLARRGLDVTIVDVSAVGLAMARATAEAAGLTLSTLCLDLEEQPLPQGPWDVVTSFHYLRRELFSQWARILAPEGLLVYEQPTRSNLDRNPRPPAPFLLEDGEILRLLVDLEVLRYHEGWQENDRHEVRLLARKSR